MAASIVGRSLQWSTAGEILAKLISPITNMILARVLAPEDFGILATVNMIITFVDLFTDSGFAKYIVQHEFKNDKELNNYIDVAFWTNLFLSVILWVFIFSFRFPIARMVGSQGYENVIVIASSQLVVTAFSSIQTSIYRRFFNFKLLFKARILTSIIPLIITVPLAFYLKNYWSLVIGAIILQLVNAIYLTVKSSWKPSIYYDFSKLYEMFSFSFWSLAESVAYWMTTWFDVFIISVAFSGYYVGLYKNSLNMVNALMLLVKTSIIPVLFSSLSRLQNDQDGFSQMYYKLQKLATLFVVPLGIGLFIFRDASTLVLFGNKWSEASNIIGAWALSSIFSVAYVSFYGEAFKAKGLPKFFFIYELICLGIMVPLCIIARNTGFWTMVYVRAALVFVQVMVGLLFMKRYIGMSISKMLINLIPSLGATSVMAIIGLLLTFSTNDLRWHYFFILVCIVVYFITLRIIFKSDVKEIIQLIVGKKENIKVK